MVFKHNQAALLGNSSFTLVDNQFADQVKDCSVNYANRMYL